MTIEDLKKLDQRIQKIPYPFGENYSQLRKIFSEAAEQQKISTSEAIRQYTGWKYSKKD